MLSTATLTQITKKHLDFHKHFFALESLVSVDLGSEHDNLVDLGLLLAVSDHEALSQVAFQLLILQRLWPKYVVGIGSLRHVLVTVVLSFGGEVPIRLQDYLLVVLVEMIHFEFQVVDTLEKQVYIPEGIYVE